MMAVFRLVIPTLFSHLDRLKDWVMMHVSRRTAINAASIVVPFSLALEAEFLLYHGLGVVTPAAGIAIAALAIAGIRYWPVIFFGALAVYAGNGALSTELLFMPAAYGLLGAAGAFALRRFDYNALFTRLQDAFLIITVSITVSTVLPSAMLLSRLLMGYLFDAPALPPFSWSAWWAGTMISTLIATPLILMWRLKRRFAHSRRETVGILIAFSLLTAAVSLIAYTSLDRVFDVSLVYTMLIPLFWIALTFGPRHIMLALAGVTAIVISGVFVNSAHSQDFGMQIFQLQALLAIMAAIFFVLTAIQEERRSVMRLLRTHVGELEGAIERLQAQDRAKSEFLAVLAHELRNPLAPLLSALELLKLKELMPARGLPAFQMIDEQLERMRRLLDDLLDISRISRGKLRIKKSTMNLAEIIGNSIRSVGVFFAKKRQMLISDIPKKLPSMEADPVRLEQAFINLLNNASKFSKEGDIISIMAKEKDGAVEVRIRDSGTGIEPRMLEQIFEPFFQVETDEAARSEGLGIGLSITKSIIELHGGTIRAESGGRGQGCELIVTLPLSGAVQIAVSGNEGSGARAKKKAESVGTYRILVVDDNVAAADGIATLLNYKGYHALCAYTGAEAHEKTLHWRPHVVILDIGLPDIDGYTVARTLRAGGAWRGAIIALTGYGQIEDKEKAAAAGFNHHLTKPIGIADLESSIQEIVEKGHGMSEAVPRVYASAREGRRSSLSRPTRNLRGLSDA